MSLGIGPAIEARRGVAHFGPALPPRGAPPGVPVYRHPVWQPAPVAPPPAPSRWQPSYHPDYRQHAMQEQLRLERERLALARMQAQTAAMQAQQAVAPAPSPVVTAPVAPTVVIPPSMPAPQPDVSPASPQADMTQTQEAAAPAVPDEHPGHKWGRRIIIGAVLAGVAYGGYRFMKSRKKGGGAHPHSSHAVHGFGRSRRRR